MCIRKIQATTQVDDRRLQQLGQFNEQIHTVLIVCHSIGSDGRRVGCYEPTRCLMN